MLIALFACARIPCAAQTASPSETRQRTVTQSPTPTPSTAPPMQTRAPIITGTQPPPTTTTTAPPTAPALTASVPAAILTTGAAISAAQQNSRLKFNLDWSFGGRQQRGWYLYTALINRETGTEKDAFTTDFALAIARWQAANNLAVTGVLDADAWYRMIAVWQARRIQEQDRAEALPSQLLTAPIIDFYDPTRAIELLKVEKQTYAAYKRMIAAAGQDSSLKLQIASNGELSIAEKRLKIISSFRSKDYQAQLRRQSPNAGRAGLALNSPHFTGRALDLYVGGEPVDTRDSNRAVQVNTPVYKWLVKNAARFGFYPYYYEPWHWEYIPPGSAIVGSQ
jgi:D-alanyl-D-alanine carboxypeptidase